MATMVPRIWTLFKPNKVTQTVCFHQEKKFLNNDQILLQPEFTHPEQLVEA